MKKVNTVRAGSLPRLAAKLLFTLCFGVLVSAQAASPSIWDGGGADSLWSNPDNWGGNVPVPGTSYDLQFGGTANLTPNNDLTPGSSFRSIVFNPGAGAFTLTGNSITLAGHLTNSSSSLQTFSLPIQSTQGRFVATDAGDITFNGVLSGAGAWNLVGPGTVTFAANNNFDGYTYVNGGILNLPAGGAINNAYYIFMGQNAGMSGSLNVMGGTITNSQASNTGNFMIGRSGFGALNFTAGTIKVNTVYIGYTGGLGTALIDGGSFYCGTGKDYVVIGNSTGMGVLTVKSGLFNHAGADRAISLNNSGIGYGEINLLGGTLDSSGNGISFGLNTALATIGTGAGVVNLDGGNLTLSRFINQKQSYTEPGDNGLSYINFNGATLTASPNILDVPLLSVSSNFIPAQIEIRVNGAFGTFAGGAVIDTAGEDVMVDSPLLAPAGDGIWALAVADGGSGYIGAPHVSVNGDGTGATAIANMVDDGTGRGTLKVGTITVTNPGENYTAGGTTFSFAGGVPTVEATAGTVSTVANTSGGLTKNGVGTLTLNDANTFFGPTVVNAGKLLFSTVHAGVGAISVADGAAFGAIRDSGTTEMAATTLTLGSATGAELDFVLPDGSPSAQLITAGTLVLNGTTTVDVSSTADLTVGAQFPLIKYTTLIGDPASITNGVLNPPAGTLAQIIYNPGNSSFDLKVTAVAHQLTWTGTVNSGGVGAWDEGITANWLNLSSAASVFLQGSDVIFNDAAAGVTSVGVTGDLSPSTMLVNNSSKDYNLDGTGSLTGNMTLTKTGTGTLTVATANSYSGATTVNGGVLALTGSFASSAGSVAVNNGTLSVSGNINTGTGAWSAGDTDASKGVININDGAALQLNGGFVLGTNASSGGAVNLTGGTLTNTQASTAANFEVGTGGYASMDMSGGTVTVDTFYVGGGSGVGVGTIRGGVFNAGRIAQADYIVLGGVTLGTGVLTVNGGVLNHINAARLFSINNSGDGRGELNLLSGTLDNTGGGIGYGYNKGAGLEGTGIVNLNGGNLILNRFVSKKQAGQGGTTGNSWLNLNGGTLTVTPSTLGSPNLSFSSDLIPALMDVRVNGAFGTFAGGAVIDTAGQNAIITSPLLAPTGDGISALSVNDGGSGYIGAPYVSIIGDGTGANAIANMISDGAGGLKVGSITVCNPGINYTAANCYFTFTGGAPTVAATPGTVATAANTSGGLTKNGLGSLTLGDASTYTGATLVNDGTLLVNGSLDAASAVTVAGGALGGNGSIGGPVIVQTGGTLAPGGTLSINNSLTLAPGSTTLMQVNATTRGGDLAQGITTANYGGTLVVSNTAGSLTVGQTFQLFNASAFTGDFAGVQSVGDGVTWGFNPTNGIATVESIAPVTGTTISFTVNGSTLSLDWPSSYLGWVAQSNSVDLGNASMWFDIPGSESDTTLDINLDPADPNVFYRLRQP